MGGMYFRRFARKARPILGERDYSAAKQLLRRSVRLSLLPGEEERMELNMPVLIPGAGST